MQASLSTPADLIVDSWVNFRKNALIYGEFAVWFAFLAAARWAIVTFTGANVSDRELRYVLNFMLSLPIFFLHAVLAVAMIHAVSAHLSKQSSGVREALYAGFHHVLPAIWTWIIGGAVFTLGLVMAIGGVLTPPVGVFFILPGLILLFPGAWLFMRYFSAAYFVTVDGMRAGASLSASAKIVSGRWWGTFSRIVFPWIFFYVAAYFVTYLIYLLIGSILGDPGLFFGQVSSADNLPYTHRLIRAVVSETVDGAALPLFVGAGVMLWNDLKRTA